MVGAAFACVNAIFSSLDRQSACANLAACRTPPACRPPNLSTVPLIAATATSRVASARAVVML